MSRDACEEMTYHGSSEQKLMLRPDSTVTQKMASDDTKAQKMARDDTGSQMIASNDTGLQKMASDDINIQMATDGTDMQNIKSADTNMPNMISDDTCKPKKMLTETDAEKKPNMSDKWKKFSNQTIRMKKMRSDDTDLENTIEVDTGTDNMDINMMTTEPSDTYNLTLSLDEHQRLKDQRIQRFKRNTKQHYFDEISEYYSNPTGPYKYHSKLAKKCADEWLDPDYMISWDDGSDDEENAEFTAGGLQLEQLRKQWLATKNEQILMLRFPLPAHMVPHTQVPLTLDQDDKALHLQNEEFLKQYDSKTRLTVYHDRIEQLNLLHHHINQFLSQQCSNTSLATIVFNGHGSCTQTANNSRNLTLSIHRSGNVPCEEIINIVQASLDRIRNNRITDSTDTEKMASGATSIQMLPDDTDTEKMASGATNMAILPDGTDTEKMALGATNIQMLPDGTDTKKISAGATNMPILPDGTDTEKMASGATNMPILPEGTATEKMASGATKMQMLPDGTNTEKTTSGATHMQMSRYDTDTEKMVSGATSMQMLPDGTNTAKMAPGASNMQMLPYGPAAIQVYPDMRSIWDFF